MRIIFLISDDFVWAPPVLHDFLTNCPPHQVVGIVGVPGTSNHRHFFSFVFVYLKVLYPCLFFRRAVQAMCNRFFASKGKALTSVSQVAAFHEISYRRCKDINDPQVLEWIKALSADLLISIQPQYIRSALLKMVPLNMNIHPAKLPAYRGPVPIFWTLYHEEKQTAVTAHFINEKFDDGDIIFQQGILIGEDETYYSLGEKITKAMPRVLMEGLKVLERGGPYLPNVAFEGAYQGYPSFFCAFKFHGRQFLKSVSKVCRIFFKASAEKS